MTSLIQIVNQHQYHTTSGLLMDISRVVENDFKDTLIRMDLMMNNRAYFVHILEESFIIYELIYMCVLQLRVHKQLL